MGASGWRLAPRPPVPFKPVERQRSVGVTATDDPPASPLSIEPAARTDLLTVYRIEQECFPQPWPYAAFEHHLEAEAFLLARQTGTIVGYVVGDLVDGFPGPVGHVKDLAVHPEYRRRGIARRLLARALVDLDDAGAVRAELEVRRSNDAARALYDEFGFERRGLRSGYYTDGEDAIVMTRTFEGLTPEMAGIDRYR